MRWEYLFHEAILICIYGILAQSFNVTFGAGRVFNLAHGASFALGAYATALLSTDYLPYVASFTTFLNATLSVSIFDTDTMTVILCLILSMAVTTIMAFLLGAISLRLSTDYFAIGTLAYSAIITALLTNWKSLTRGVLGIPGIPRPSFLGFETQENANFLILAGSIFVVTQIILFITLNNSFARRLRAQGDSEIAAMAVGMNPRLDRLRSFLMSSAGAGIAGCLFAFFMNFIDPSSFSLNEMIFVLTIVIVGKPGSFWGVIAATIFLFALDEGISFIPWINHRPTILGPLRQLVRAAILFGVVYFNRRKLFPATRNV